MASKCDDFAYNRIIAFKVSESLRVKSQLSNDAFRNLRKWFEMILNHFEIQSSFQKKQLLELFFSGDFQNLKKMDFFSRKSKKIQNFISFVLNEFWSDDINFFFQWKLRLHTFQWGEVYIAQTNKSSHLKLQSAFEKWEKTFLSTGSKIVAFKLQMCPNSILRSEMELTTHFWSRTTLVHVYHSHSDLCGKKSKKTIRALEWSKLKV